MIIKKNSLVIVICLIVIAVCSLCLYSSGKIIQEKSKNTKNIPTIIIDAGHGGIDGGAVGADGTVEKKINLEISQKLNQLCKAFGYNTIMVRSDDNAICDKDAVTIRQKKVSDIHNRFKIMEDNPNSLFISIHQNKFHNTKYLGAQVFYSPNADSSKNLADSIRKSINTRLQPNNNRQIKASGTEIYLLYHAKSTAVMVECGFMSNPKELGKLKTSEYQKEIAMSIFSGITDYIMETNV